jgi:hypothetical protein
MVKLFFYLSYSLMFRKDGMIIVSGDGAGSDGGCGCGS